MTRPAAVLLATTLGVALAAATPAPAAAPGTVLRLDGVGPLKLGMSRTAALRTGWLADRHAGCPLGGPPVPIGYRLRGPRAPAGVRGRAEFRGGRLRTLTFTRGVRTPAGVTVGVTTTARMVARYRAAGFEASARFLRPFGGTFVTVRRRGRQVLGGFARGRVVGTLGVPAIPVCE